MRGKIRLCCVQSHIEAGQKETNLSRIQGCLEQLPPDLDLVCLPELFSTGYALNEVEGLAEKIPGPTTQQLKVLARKLGTNIIGGSILETGDDGLYNTAVVIDRSGETVGRYRKVHLFSPFGEQHRLRPGREIVSFQLDKVRIGVMICYDLRFPEVARRLALDGAEVILVPAEFPEQRLDHWRHLLIARAIENQVFVAGVNRIGVDERNRYGGHSMVIDPWGEIVEEAGEEEEVLLVELDLDRIEEVRTSIPAFHDRRPEVY